MNFQKNPITINNVALYLNDKTITATDSTTINLINGASLIIDNGSLLSLSYSFITADDFSELILENSDLSLDDNSSISINHFSKLEARGLVNIFGHTPTIDDEPGDFIEFMGGGYFISTNFYANVIIDSLNYHNNTSGISVYIILPPHPEGISIGR